MGTFLAGRGYEVTVFAPGVDLRTQSLFPEVRGKLHSDTVVQGVRVIRPWCLEKFRINIFRRFLFECLYALSVVILFFKVKRPDVIIGAYPPAILPIVGLVISKIIGVPFIFEVRDLMADALIATQYSKSVLFNRVAVFVEKMIYAKADHIVTVSDGIKDRIIRKNIHPDKITPIKNGYEPQLFENPDRSIIPRKEFGWGDKFVVIYAGGLTQSYDIDTLLKAAEITSDDSEIMYVIIGDGEKKEEYKWYARKKGLANVQFLEVRPRKMMPAILSSANVGVHLFPDDPLWGYVLGNKPFDYLASGLAMIYCGRGDTAELVSQAGAGFVLHPERPEDLAEKITWLKKHPAVREEMGRSGKDHVKRHWNRFNLLEKLDDVIRNIVKP
jgi:glycosyltransferase involved in cell wall biosynthesis